MKIIEEVFKKYPFIYYIGGRYYAFGTGVCAECKSGSCSLESHYKRYINNYNEDLSRDQAFRIWHSVVGEAEYVKHEQGICLKPEEEIVKFVFSNEKIKELEEQAEAYIDFWKKYNLKEYME